MNIFWSIFLGVVIGLAIALVRFFLAMKPIVVDLNSPKYKAMKDYDSYESWKKDWC